MTEEEGILLTAWLTLLLGIFMFSLGVYTFYYFYIGKKKKCTAETTGTVVDQVGDGNSKLYPVVEYEVNGKVYRKRNSATITTQSARSINWNNGYRRGQKLTVHYDPDKPTRWMINDSKEQKVLPIIFLSFGLAIFAVAAIIFITA